VFEELSTVEQNLVKIISQNDAETAVKIMFAIMRDCMCTTGITTPDDISKLVSSFAVQWQCFYRKGAV
jgi:hypothetical protein